jgi:UDP-N-acetylglucosamine transferase subunit ALG13
VARVVKVLSKSSICRTTALIFLTVGNWHKGFDRLVQAVDELKGRGDIDEEVLAQVGSGTYRPHHLTIMDYCSPSEFINILAKSRVVITHAGIGTICQAIQVGKPVVVVPRKARLGECGDDHQWITAELLESQGKILVACEVSELAGKLRQARTFVPLRVEDGSRIIEAVDKYLLELALHKYGE